MRHANFWDGARRAIAPIQTADDGSHSLASALVFFGPEVVSMIDEGRIEAYKTWRMNEHGVRDVTVRHDLHALSTFFQCAIKQHWTRDNPIRRVELRPQGALSEGCRTPTLDKIQQRAKEQCS